MLRAAGVFLLAGIDPELQAILRRRQRAGREVIQGARRVEGLVEVHQRRMALRQRDVEEASAAVSLMSAGGVREHDEQLFVARSFEHGIEPPLAAILPEYHRARGLCLLLHAKDVHDLEVVRRLVGLEAGVEHPVGADREVAEPAEVAAVGIVEITHPHAQIAGALDDEEAQRAAGEHRRFTLGIGGEIQRCDRPSVVRHAGTGTGDETHLVTGLHE